MSDRSINSTAQERTESPVRAGTRGDGAGPTRHHSYCGPPGVSDQASGMVLSTGKEKAHAETFNVKGDEHHPSPRTLSKLGQYKAQKLAEEKHYANSSHPKRKLRHKELLVPSDSRSVNSLASGEDESDQEVFLKKLVKNKDKIWTEHTEEDTTNVEESMQAEHTSEDEDKEGKNEKKRLRKETTPPKETYKKTRQEQSSMDKWFSEKGEQDLTEKVM
ncbi:hypothetical protein ABEB36_006163 [Hypothenemus hampei]|uniref:Uncharacterized protein n=1 Tax=Hypothenemus hampei TaxID=57062 RepID=A0ABD1EPK7_HYPHA